MKILFYFCTSNHQFLCAMKRYNILWNLCVLFILTVLPNFGYSQLLNKIKQSVQNGVERGLLNTLEDKVEEETKDLLENETSADKIDTTQSIEISDEEAIWIDRLRYVISHGVKENLVLRCRDWPGEKRQRPPAAIQ